MNVTFKEEQPEFSELFIDGSPVRYKLPPIIGNHQECFSESNYNETLRMATGKEVAAYVYGALVHRKNEWADQERIMFPTKYGLRIPVVLTIIPTRMPKFGDLEGAMLVDNDLKGEGVRMKTEVPSDLSGWDVLEGGILKKDGRIAVPYSRWYGNATGDGVNNGASLAIFKELESSELLAKAAKDSGGHLRFCLIDPIGVPGNERLSAPERVVPVLNVWSDVLTLSCQNGFGKNCAVRVLK